MTGGDYEDPEDVLVINYNFDYYVESLFEQEEEMRRQKRIKEIATEILQ